MKIITFWLTMHQIFFYQTCQLCRYKQCRLPASVPWQHGSSRPPVRSSFQVCYLGCYRLTPLRPTPWGHACLAASTWIINTTSGILNSSADPWSAPVFEVPCSTSRASYHWMSFALGRGRVSWIGLKCRFYMLQSSNIINIHVRADKTLPFISILLAAKTWKALVTCVRCSIWCRQCCCYHDWPLGMRSSSHSK